MEKKRKALVGRVISNKMQKTVVVEVAYTVQDPRYKKYLRRTQNLKAHDEKGECQVGDRVRMIHTRPLSAQKHWAVLEILEKAE